MAPETRARARTCKRCFVSGRVQGVFYRATAVNKARELGIDGFARNLTDGRVEVVACGEPRAVEQLAQWLWTGSSASKVTDVHVEEASSQGVAPGAGFSAR